MNKRWLSALVLTATGFSTVAAWALPCDTQTGVSKNWYFPLGTNPIAAQPGSDSFGEIPTPPKTYTYVVATDSATMITKLSRIAQDAATGGGQATTDCYAQLPTGEKAVNAPTPVPLSPLSSNTQAIFVASSAGKVYRYNFASRCSGGSPIAPDWVVDLRRKGPGGTFTCTGAQTDTITAAPTVQIADYSAGAGAPTQDLVIVPTHYGCTSTDNRVIALAASNGAIVWKSNMYSAPADYFSDSCSIDYGNNYLYCGAHDPGGPFQNTLFAYASVPGTLTADPIFQLKPGSISNRVMTRAGILIAATEEGSVVGYNLSTPDSPFEAWRVNLTGLGAPGSVTFHNSPWAESRYNYQSAILLVDGNGSLYRVDEATTHDSAARIGSVLTASWTDTGGVSHGGKFTSTPAVDANLGKVYISSDLGRVHQVDFSGSGFNPATSLEASAYIGAGAQLYDPMLDVTPGAAQINRLVVAGDGQLRQFTVPWFSGCNSTSGFGSGKACAVDTDCPVAKFGDCAKPTCDTTSGICKFTFINNGKACSKGLTCGVAAPSMPTCSDGVCVPTDASDCCGNTKEVQNQSCGKSGGSCCANTCTLLTDQQNCGACGKVCAADTTCVLDGQGFYSCQRQTNACVGVPNTKFVTQNSNTVNGVSAFAFDRDLKRNCNIYAGSTASSSTVYKFTPTGIATAIAPIKGGYNNLPINGISVTPTGTLLSGTQTAGKQVNPHNGTFSVPPGATDQDSPLYANSSKTIGTAYIDANYDTGSPLSSYSTLVATAKPRIFIANNPKDGQVSYVDASVSPASGLWTYSTTPVFVQSFGTTRISALAFAPRSSSAGPEGTIFAAIGATIVQYCEPKSTNNGNSCILPTRTLDLSKTGNDYSDYADPDGGTLQKAWITDILNISTDPVYGATLISARDAAGNIELLYMDPVGGSVRNYATWPFVQQGKRPPANLGKVDYRTGIFHNGIWGLKLGTFPDDAYTINPMGVWR